jgi:hypothetical protein
MPSVQTFLLDDDGAYLTDEDGTLLREDTLAISWRRRFVAGLASLFPARDVGGDLR